MHIKIPKGLNGRFGRSPPPPPQKAHAVMREHFAQDSHITDPNPPPPRALPLAHSDF